MVTALQDLRNRIASNTLTGPQQAALDTALDVLIPLFPTPDELSNSIPQTEENLAREWIAPLYTLQAQAGPGGSVLPTTAIAFFVNALTGSNTNDGLTSGTPLQTIAALAALWRGTAGGGRPVLAPATGTTVTVTLQTDLPLTDPLAPILDVDITGGASLVIVSTAKAATHTGVVATANVWARTIANGQVKITDGAVADYGPLVGAASLFIDDTLTSVAWLYGPDTGASATGVMTVAYQPQTAGVASIPTQSNVTAADAYTLSDVVHVALGTGFTTRSFPEGNAGSGTESAVFFYRLRLTNPGSAPATQFASPSVTYNMQECMYDVTEIIVESGGFSAVNCFGYHSLGVVGQAGAFVELFAGGISGLASGTVQAAAASTVAVDGDFALFSAAPYVSGKDGLMLMGNASRWNNAGSQAMTVTGGTLIVSPVFQAGAVAYGTDAGGDFAIINSQDGNAGAILYVNDGGGTPAQDAFKFTDVAWTMGTLAASAFGLSQTTGLAVGPTTNTLAHLDAAIGVGTGFGGAAVDPRSGSTFRIDT